jgi:hypothetical protein
MELLLSSIESESGVIDDEGSNIKDGFVLYVADFFKFYKK